MVRKILLTGASGLVGTALQKQLKLLGYAVNILTRKKTDKPNTYVWNVYQQTIDPKCFEGVDAVIHLAGEGVVDEKWTAKRKQQIIDSRVKSTELLLEQIKKLPNQQIKTFISASAVGFYGDGGENLLTEENLPGTGFLADCCQKWEEAVSKAEKLQIRTVKLRTGIVLSKNGGALPQMDKPIKFFVGAPLGTGKQWVPWLHIDDMVNMYIAALENNNMQGNYNAAAPLPVTNKTLTKCIGKCLNRPIWPFSIPSWVMKLILGERALAVLMSSKTSAQKIIDTGYTFAFERIEDALKNIYQN